MGFHTHDYTRYFLTSVLRTVGYEHQLGLLTLRDRVVTVDTFPMGIDFERFARAAAARETEARVAELRTKCVGQKVIFSVDRLDYTKGLINRLHGYEVFLKRNPQWHGKVVFVVSVAPSRLELARNCVACAAGCLVSCSLDTTIVIRAHETNLKTSLCSDRGGWCGAALFHSCVGAERRCPEPEDYHRLYRRR